MNILYLIAQTPTIKADKLGIQKITSTEILANGLNAVYFAAGALAVIIIIVAGYQFTTAVYDPAKIAIAKNALIYAITGLVVVMAAFIVTQFIIGRF